MNYNPLSKHNLPQNNEQNKDKTLIGVLFAIFLGVTGLIVGLLLYPIDTKERKTFLSAWSITFPIVVISLIILLVCFYDKILSIIIPNIR